VAALEILVAEVIQDRFQRGGDSGYQSTNALVNTDWSQLSDAVALSVALSVALPVARQVLHWSNPKKGSVAKLGA
jgi:hypothetical protein